ncbi:MAG: helix-turn-helix transcriptional regulator [Variovorax sp.]
MSKKKLPPDPNLGKNIEALMALTPELGSQAAVAARAGLAQSTIGRILRGEVKVNATNLQKLAHTFGVTTDVLLQDHESSFPLRDARHRYQEPRFARGDLPSIPVSGELEIRVADVEIRAMENAGTIVGVAVDDGYVLRVHTGGVLGLYPGVFLVFERQGMPAGWDLCLIQMMDGTRRLARYVDTEGDVHVLQDARSEQEFSVPKSQVASMHGAVAIASTRQHRA